MNLRLYFYNLNIHFYNVYIVNIKSKLTPTTSLLSFTPSSICPPFLFLNEHTISKISLVKALLDFLNSSKAFSSIDKISLSLYNKHIFL